MITYNVEMPGGEVVAVRSDDTVDSVRLDVFLQWVKQFGQGARIKGEAMNERTPSPLDIFDTSLASLRNLWSDSPETYALVVRAVSCHQEMLDALKMVWNSPAFGPDLKRLGGRYGQIPNIIDRAEGRSL